VSGLNSFKNFKNHTTGCGDIVYSSVGHFILSHPVHYYTCVLVTHMQLHGSIFSHVQVIHVHKYTCGENTHTEKVQS